MIVVRGPDGKAQPIDPPRTKQGWHKKAEQFRADHCEYRKADLAKLRGGCYYELHAHHVDGDYTHCVRSNIVTLCRGHHLRIHGKRSRREMGWRYRRGAA